MSAVSSADSFHTACSSSSLVERAASGAIAHGQASLVRSETERRQVRVLWEWASSEGIARGIPNGERWYEDAELLRYVRAKPTIDDAKELFQKAMAWRRDHVHTWGVDVAKTGSYGPEYAALMSGGNGPGIPDWWKFIRRNILLDLYGKDREGLPICYFGFGNVDLRGMVQEVGLEALVKYCVYVNDRFFDAARDATIKAGEIRVGGVVIVDLGGLAWGDAKSKVQTLKEMGEQSRCLHPERQRCTFVVRAPGWLSAMWWLVSQTLDPRTVAKVKVLTSSSDALKPMIDELGIKNVPDFLGGTCTAVKERPLQ